MQIEKIPIEKLKPAPYNPRKISPEAFEKLNKSLQTFGLVDPLIVNKRTGFTVVGGHQRLEVMKANGITEADCVILDIEEDREKLLNIALNNQNMAGEYDFSKMADMLVEFDQKNIDATIAGFDSKEIEQIMNWTPEGKEESKPVPQVSKEAITKPGDVWELGEHRVMCGDSSSEEDVECLMGGKFGNLMATDPPYGVEFGTKNYNPTAKKWDKIENDDVTGDQLKSLLSGVWERWIPKLHETFTAYVWSPSLFEGFQIAQSIVDSGIHIQSQIVWNKNQFALGQADYQWRHEVCWYGFLKGKKHQWFGERDKDTVWNVKRDAAMKYEHPTQKPVELFEIPIRNGTKSGQIVCDPFLGSGSQLIAAERTGRKCYAMEIEPRYVDVAVKRFINFASEKPVKCSRPEAVDQIMEIIKDQNENNR